MTQEVLKQALEALKCAKVTASTPGNFLFFEEAITAIKEALAQPQQEHKCKTHPDAPHGFARNASHAAKRYVCECAFWEQPQQEPVAWLCSDNALSQMGYNRFSLRCEGAWNIPLYTSPPQRKPLTDERIEEIRTEQEFDLWGIGESAFKYATRAIEAAHGIKE